MNSDAVVHHRIQQSFDAYNLQVQPASQDKSARAEIKIYHRVETLL